MRLIRLAAILSLASVVGCRVGLSVPDGAAISCAGNRDCPTGDTCALALHLCVSQGAVLPEQRVVFTVPSNDANTNISTSVAIVVAFSLPVKAASLPPFLSLSRAEGSVTLAAPQATADPNVVIVQPAEELAPLTHYTLTVAQGVSTETVGEGLPTQGDYALDFVTGERPDRTPPAPLLGAVVDQTSDSHATLSWTLAVPLDAPPTDFSGVLVLQKTAPITTDDWPQTGLTYAAQDVIGGAVVAAIVRDTQTDVTFAAGYYDWAFFVVDGAANYSTPVSVPYVTGTQVSWCPKVSGGAGEGGTFSAVSSEAVVQTLYVGAVAANAFAPIVSGAQSAAGTLASFASPGDVTLRTSYDMRVVVDDPLQPGFEYRGPITSVTTSSAGLDPLVQVAPTGHGLGPGGIAAFGFNPYAWPAIEGAVDVDASLGSEDYSGAVSLGATSASATMLQAGFFRLRVRPVVSGCGDADWVLSDEFAVAGGVRYVSAIAGNDSNNGMSRLTPYQTIGKAIADANGIDDLDVLIAKGTYNEPVLTKSQMRFYGGYASDFSARDTTPATEQPTNETILTGSITTAGGGWDDCNAAFAVPNGATVLADRITMAPASKPAGLSNNNCGAYVRDFGIATFTNDRMIGPVTQPAAGNSYGFASRSGNVTVTDNLIAATTTNFTGNNSIGVFFINGGTDGATVVSGNTIQGAIGMRLYRDTFTLPLIEDNRIEASYDGSATGDINGNVIGVACETGYELELRRNVITTRYDSFTPNGTWGLTRQPTCTGTIEDNIIDGGGGGQASVGIDLAGATQASNPLRIINNLISSGSGTKYQSGIIVGDAPYVFGGGANSTLGPDVIIAHNAVLVGVDVPGLTQASHAAIVWQDGGSWSWGGRIVNNLFFTAASNGFIAFAAVNGNVPEALQNNLFVNDAFTTFAQTSGGTDSTLSAMTTRLCNASLYMRTSSNAESTEPPQAPYVTLSDLLVSPGGADGLPQTLEDNDWHIKPGQESVFAIGLDTTVDQCGGNAGTANACVGPGSNPCGSITADKDGKPRPATPSVGPYEP